jgi:2-polyprenyl-3-methyl-5-hydroxy-6-metoxy-1,4-benzoquinol methylase
MKFYSSIADYYDNIFPLKPVQVEFITGFVETPFQGKSILDIGCGTGNLALALTELGFQVSGIDLDPEMVGKARKKADKLDTPSKPIFTVMDMRDIGNNFLSSYFDIVTCFGNTLAHLTSEDDLVGFLQELKSILKPTGELLIQIINYDYILENGIDKLPTTENSVVKFQRAYNYNKNSNLVYFKTELLIKETGEMLKNEIPLKPIRKKELEGYLTQAGYRHLQFYGSFAKEELRENSLPLIIKADN